MAILEHYPPLNTHFSVEFHTKKQSEEEKFQSVQGLQARLINDETHKDPYAVFDNIILRRAYKPNSKVVAWCMNAINNKVFEEKTLTIRLLNSKHKLISAWVIEKVIPVGWGVEELHAQDAKILIEVIELKYSNFQVLNTKGKNVALKRKPRGKK